jgi:hypothetical protein
MTSNKILPVALVAALLGGTVGAFVMRPNKNTPESAQLTTNGLSTTPASSQNAEDKAAANDQNALLENEIASETKNMSDEERAAFRNGFVEGVQAASSSDVNGTRTAATHNYAASSPTRVVYRPATRTRYVRTQAPRRVYYDYGQRSGRSFWQKHRDKLTVGIGSGAGALLGGLIGGRKGAAIGALSGAGGSALYTYKIRKRHRNY